MNSGIVNKNIIVYYIRKWVRLLCKMFENI